MPTAPAFRALPRLAGGLAILAGALVLVGWSLDIDPLKRGLPGLVSMNPMTAVAFVLAGVSMCVQDRAGSLVSGTARAWARLTAIAVIGIGLVRLAGYGLEFDYGIDQWLFTAKLHDDATGLPNRMAPNTALVLFLLGSALLLLDVTTARNRRPAELLAALVLMTSLLALFGYAYQVPRLYGVAAHMPMALHTAMISFLLALGVLFARPGHGLMALATNPGMGGVQLRRLLPAMVLSMFVLGWVRLEGERRGLYGMELGVALYTLATITILSALVWWSAAALRRVETERALAASARDQALALNRLIMDNSLDVICAIDGDGRFVAVSAASTRLWGYAPTELTGRAYVDLVHPDDIARSAEVAGAVMSGQSIVGFSNRYLRKDGRVLEIDWSASWSERDDLMFCVARDATARKLAEQRLRESEERTRRIIDTAQDAFVAIDGEGLVSDWNRQAEATFGWTRTEAVGRQLSELIIPPRYRHAHEQGLRRFLASGEGPVLNRRIELSALHRDGGEFPIELTIWPLETGHGHCFNAFIRDITERRSAEQSILALNAELTANASQLQQTNRELEAFSYTVSHDLRAPLRHIDGYAQMLQEDAGPQLDADMRRYLDAIGDSARRMGMLIDDLLAFSRLGRKPLDRVAVDMDGLVARALEEAAGNLPRAARVSLGPLPDLDADPILLRQVWVNLLSNALKYSATRGDGAHIEVSGQSDGAVNRYTVRDNGVGFDMRYADNLFGVFQRLHSQEEFEGTGVGLAIVQRIVTRHGGRIWAEAQPGLGATFTFELPNFDARAMEAAA